LRKCLQFAVVLKEKTQESGAKNQVFGGGKGGRTYWWVPRDMFVKRRKMGGAVWKRNKKSPRNLRNSRIRVGGEFEKVRRGEEVNGLTIAGKAPA